MLNSYVKRGFKSIIIQNFANTFVNFNIGLLWVFGTYV